MRSRLIKKDKELHTKPYFDKERKDSFFSKSNSSFYHPNDGSKSVALDDKHNLTSSALSGDIVLERCFDGNQTIKAYEEGDHVTKLQKGLVDLGFELPKYGIDGKFGEETKQAVKNFQASTGMATAEQDGIIGRKTIGVFDQSLRNDKAEKDPDKPENDQVSKDKKQDEKDEQCKGQPTEKSCPNPNDSAIKAADQAIQLVDAVLEQLPPKFTKQADYPTIFNKVFRFNDPGTLTDKVDQVRKNFLLTKSFISSIKTNPNLIRCGSDCDGGCRSGSPAYHTPMEGKHIITFCPSFETHKDKILIVLHESHHAAVAGSKDYAYADTRLFLRLDHNKALLNAASFHVYAGMVNKPGSVPMGPDIPDTDTISNKNQKVKVDSSLAFIEQWFRLIPFDVSTTVKGAQRAREHGKYVDHNPPLFMNLVFSKWFGLTRAPAVPSTKDIAMLLAIEERARAMEKAFENPFIILQTANHSFWERGPGSGIALNDATLALELQNLTIALLQELVHATPDISAGSEPLYVGAFNDMRNTRDLDP